MGGPRALIICVVCSNSGWDRFQRGFDRFFHSAELHRVGVVRTESRGGTRAGQNTTATEALELTRSITTNIEVVFIDGHSTVDLWRRVSPGNPTSS